MNENSIKQIENNADSLSATLGDFVTRNTIVNLATITKVHNPDYVDVKLYYKNNANNDVIITDVRLLHIGTAACKLNIEPTEGDNIILLTPKDFVSKLEYKRKPEKSKNIYAPYPITGACGIIVKAETDDEVKTTINIDKDGNISLSTDGDTSVNVEGDASVTVDGDATVDIGGDSTLTVEGDASVDATGDLKAETKGDATIKATKDVKIDCVNAEIKSTAKTSVKLGAITAFEVAL